MDGNTVRRVSACASGGADTTMPTPHTTPPGGGGGTPTGHRRAAWTLLVLTPLIAELSFGSTPIRFGYLVLLWIPIYGAGVLLIRELVRRTGRGWPSILLLGLAYGLLEDGIGLQALTSPNLYGAADWGMRVAGINLAYWEATALYHVVFSVAIPIALVELIFRRYGHQPYLRTGGLIITAVVTVLGVAVLRLTVPPSQDPGYVAPLPYTLTAVVAICVIGVVALRGFPAWRRVGNDLPVAAVPWWYAGSLLASLAYLLLSHPMFGADQPANADGDAVVLPMLAVAVLAAGCGVVGLRAARSARWTDRHTLAVIGGALVGHTIGGIPMTAFVERHLVDRLALAVIAVITVVLIALLDRRLRESGRGAAVATTSSASRVIHRGIGVARTNPGAALRWRG